MAVQKSPLSGLLACDLLTLGTGATEARWKRRSLRRIVKADLSLLPVMTPPAKRELRRPPLPHRAALDGIRCACLEPVSVGTIVAPFWLRLGRCLLARIGQLAKRPVCRRDCTSCCPTRWVQQLANSIPHMPRPTHSRWELLGRPQRETGPHCWIVRARIPTPHLVDANDAPVVAILTGACPLR